MEFLLFLLFLMGCFAFIGLIHEGIKIHRFHLLNKKPSLFVETDANIKGIKGELDYYAGVYTYVDNNNINHDFTGRWYLNQENIDDKIKVYYLKDKPQVKVLRNLKLMTYVNFITLFVMNICIWFLFFLIIFI